MPYRHSHAHGLCTECKADAVAACLRCGRPLCARHAPAEGLRCLDCESEFDHSTRRNARWSVLLGLLFWLSSLAALIAAPRTPIWTRLFELVFIAGGPVLVGSAAAGNKLLYDRQRRRFLAQRKHKELPPPQAAETQTASDSDDDSPVPTAG